jgi:hypothetical protein
MSKTSPPPSAGTAKEKEQIRRVVEARQLIGAANDTKWAVLLDAIRSREGWRPSYRYKCVDGPVSGWDVEWWYHLPFPMMSVEWFDISLVQETPRGRLIRPAVTDHREWILALLQQTGFCYEVGQDIVRIFGYLPKNYDKFIDEDPA